MSTNPVPTEPIAVPVVRSWRRRLTESLSKPLWQGVSALVGMLSVILAVAALWPDGTPEKDLSVSPVENNCVIHGNGNHGNVLTCNDGWEGRPAPTSPSPSVVPSRPDVSKEPSPATETGEPGRAVGPTRSARTSPPVPQPTPPFDRQRLAESGQTFEAYDWPTFIALYEPQAKRVTEQSMADLQVEAAQLAPLNNAKAAMASAAGTCSGVQYSSFAVEFNIQDRPAICVRSRLGADYLIEIKPTNDSERRPLPYVITVFKR